MTSAFSTLLGAIRWSEAFKYAPTLARGARKLWQRTRNDQDERSTPAPDADRLELLTARLESLEHGQRESTELIAELALQNEKLVQTLERMRDRLEILSILTLILGFITVAAIVWLSISN